LATPLHDVGKIGIDAGVLNKAGPLTSDERTMMQEHTRIGAHILQGSESNLIKTAYEIALYHHEKWDGTGYGQGVSGTNIPLSARIAALADVFDALCSKRSYKEAWPFEKAVQEVRSQSRKHFDPSCVEAFDAGLEDIRELYLETSSNRYVAQ
jgi:putative two-component system response regulator